MFQADRRTRHLQVVPGGKERRQENKGVGTMNAYRFPGNARELANIIERAYALGANTQITITDLPALAANPTPSGEPRTLEDLERELVAATLRAHGNDKAKAAEALGLSERTLYRRLKKLGL